MHLKRMILSHAPYVLRLRAKWRERNHEHAAYFRQLREVFYEKLWTDTARELGAEIKAMGYGFHQLRWRGKATTVCGPEVMLDHHLNLRLAGNKPLVNRILAEQRFPIVRYYEFDVTRLEEAYAFLATLGGPGVVKPADAGSAGKGITTGIQTRGQLRRAALWASCFSPTLILENQIEGDSYRLLFLNGRFLDAIRRNPPCVRGDGKRTIQELIAAENARRMDRGAIIALHPLTIDAELKGRLRSGKLHLQHILAQDETLAVKSVVNQNSRYENESVRDVVHPDIVKSGAQIARLLQIELAGIDLICRDITRPLDPSNGVVNEVNTTPALHHHYLIANKSEIAPVALQIQKYIFNDKK